MAKPAIDNLAIFLGGECFEKYGRIAKKLRAAEGGDPSFTRDSVGYGIGPDNVLREFAVDAPRIHYCDYDGTGLRPTLTLNNAVTQLVHWSVPGAGNKPTLNSIHAGGGELTSSIVNFETLGIPDPHDPNLGEYVLALDTGASGAYARSLRLGDNSTLNGITAGEWAAFSALVLIPFGSDVTPGNVVLRIVDDVTGATYSTAATKKGEWEFLHVEVEISAGATNVYVQVLVEHNEDFGTANDTVYIAVPTVTSGQSTMVIPIPNDAAGTLAIDAEELVFPSARRIEAGTWYLKWVELGNVAGAVNAIYFSLGATSGGSQLFFAMNTSGTLRARLDFLLGDGTGEDLGSILPSGDTADAETGTLCEAVVQVTDTAAGLAVQFTELWVDGVLAGTATKATAANGERLAEILAPSADGLGVSNLPIGATHAGMFLAALKFVRGGSFNRAQMAALDAVVS